LSDKFRESQELSITELKKIRSKKHTLSTSFHNFRRAIKESLIEGTVMNGLIKLILLSTPLLLVGCNEKVSPDLKQGAASSGPTGSTGPGPTIVPPSVYYFGVNNVSSYMLNYKLHKTGSGNANAECVIKKNVPLTNDLYRATINAADNSDISCFMEVEELALFFAGMKLEVAASSNTCDYVAYAPFSYYNRMPGSSSTELSMITCSEDFNDGNVPAGLVEYDDGSLKNATCEKNIIDTNIALGQRRPFNVSSDEELCRFNYTDGDEEQCDIGVIDITEHALSYDEENNVVRNTTTRKLKCGGKHYNCIKGPIRLLNTQSSRFTEIISTTRNESFTKSYDFPSLITNIAKGTTEYANFRRNLADPTIDYKNNDDVDYPIAFANKKDFTPRLMDHYSNNKRMDGTTVLISSEQLENASYGMLDLSNKYYTKKPLAAEPFLGFGTFRTNPFYTFYCLDNAFDIKARIRIIVRDWDRIFPSTNANFELISDINLSDARQDVAAGSVEVEGDQDGLNPLNDLRDWDDLLPMTRSSGALNLGETIWGPTNGFFKSGTFPNASSN
jgi:hypothetical protein